MVVVVVTVVFVVRQYHCPSSIRNKQRSSHLEVASEQMIAVFSEVIYLDGVVPSACCNAAQRTSGESRASV